MADTISNKEPLNQLRVNDPYQQRLFDFNTADSRLYLAKVSNLLLKTFGDNIVLSGFDYKEKISNDSTIIVEENSTIVSLKITPGIAIINNTLIEVSETTDLKIDLDGYDETGSVIVYLDYVWIQTATPNPLRIKISHVSADGKNVSPEDWSVNRNKLILGIFKFTKMDDGSNNISQFAEIVGNPKQVLIEDNFYQRFGYLNGIPAEIPKDINLHTYFTYSGLGGAGGGTGSGGLLPKDFDGSLGHLVDEALLVFSKNGQIQYDVKGRISKITMTQHKDDTVMILTYSYATEPPNEILGVNCVSNGSPIWQKLYTYYDDEDAQHFGDIKGWNVVVSLDDWN